MNLALFVERKNISNFHKQNREDLNMVLATGALSMKFSRVKHINLPISGNHGQS